MNRLLLGIGGFFALCGVVVIVAGTWGLLEADSVAASMKKMGVEAEPEFPFESVEEWHTAFLWTSSFYLAVGVLLTAGGLGIARAHRWARLSWLVGLIALFAGDAYTYTYATAAGLDDFVGLAFYASLTAFSFWLLFRSQLSAQFRQGAQPGAPGDGPRPAGSARA